MMEENEMQTLLGIETTEEIIEWFDGKSDTEVLAELNRCWPHETGNKEFVEKVKDFVKTHAR